jgi:endonuclease/exonuclease/phosphatase (EEP) superfamily protein YafD
MPIVAAIIAFGWRVTAELQYPERLLLVQNVATIVTHNVSVRNHAPRATARALLASEADVLLLQETDGTFAPLLKALRRQYRYATPCKRDACSMAILSRWPIVNSSYRVRDSQGRQIGPALMRARIQPASAPAFEAVTLHFPWPLPAEQHAKLRGQLAQVLPLLDRDELVLAGDLNLTPWSFAMRDLDAALQPLTRVTRALPSFPARLASGHTISWPLLPIDHVFTGRAWITSSVDRLPRTGSDHYPVRVRLTHKK